MWTVKPLLMVDRYAKFGTEHLAAAASRIAVAGVIRPWCICHVLVTVGKTKNG